MATILASREDNYLRVYSFQLNMLFSLLSFSSSLSFCAYKYAKVCKSSHLAFLKNVRQFGDRGTSSDSYSSGGYSRVPSLTLTFAPSFSLSHSCRRTHTHTRAHPHTRIFSLSLAFAPWIRPLEENVSFKIASDNQNGPF